MIQTSELRIGSIYKFLEGDCFSGETEPLHTAHFWTAHEYSEKIEDHVEGIPLTPEILEKCGFVKWEPQPGIIQYRLNDGELTGEVDKIGEWAFNPGIDGYWIEKQYLHQLQNLYFALTGEEIIYTL